MLELSEGRVEAIRWGENFLTGYQRSRARSVKAALTTKTWGPFYVTRRIYEVEGQVEKTRAMSYPCVGGIIQSNTCEGGENLGRRMDFIHSFVHRLLKDNG
jgi:hypothetical protein